MTIQSHHPDFDELDLVSSGDLVDPAVDLAIDLVDNPANPAVDLLALLQNDGSDEDVSETLDWLFDETNPVEYAIDWCGHTGFPADLPSSGEWTAEDVLPFIPHRTEELLDIACVSIMYLRGEEREEAESWVDVIYRGLNAMADSAQNIELA